MTDRREMTDVLTSLLLEWGRTSFQAEKFPGHLSDIQHEIDRIEDVNADILQKVVVSIVQDALAFAGDYSQHKDCRFNT
jgi:hypothetical protein